MITGEALEARLAGLDEVGREPDGFHRLAWTPAYARATAWFERQAQDVGLTVHRDPAGNLWACPAAPGPWWGVGSHIDTVSGGGRYDGALGVAAAFAIAAEVDAPICVLSFVDEEGARFNTPTFGSRALAGRIDVPEVLGRADADGITMADAMTSLGVDPAGLAEAPAALEDLSGFLELHIDQSRELDEAGEPIGVVSALAGRMRLAIHVEGEADHAGTTRKGERRDALVAAAHIVTAAEELAEGDPAFVVTPTRILVEPNALSTIPGDVRLWLDARAPDIADVDAWRASLQERVEALASRRRVTATIELASRSAGARFDPRVRATLRASAAAAGGSAPEVVCFAGHDAGILADLVPTGMVLVRNPTGISHNPAEAVDVADAAIAAQAVAKALEELA